MIGYVTLGATDMEAALAFYDAVLAPLGWKQFARHGDFAGYGPGGDGAGQTIWVCKPFDGQPAKPGNGVMLAFNGETRAQVDALYAAAMAHGGSDEGPPACAITTGPTGTPPTCATRPATSSRSSAPSRWSEAEAAGLEGPPPDHRGAICRRSC